MAHSQIVRAAAEREAGSDRGTSPRRFSPYRVIDSGKALHEVIAYVNDACYQGYGPDYRLGSGADKIICDSLFQYERLLRRLTSMPAMQFLPHRDLTGRACPPDKIVCGIRHDVDADIRAALSLAEVEHRYGVTSTYYILHTAPYYGRFGKGVFHRNQCMALLYRKIQELGHEIALHTDALYVYQEFGIDGAEALRCELAWLRSQGLGVVGTAAHNSASVYGAENYAIFKGRDRAMSECLTKSAGSNPRAEVSRDGRIAPLEVLDEGKLGLTYEANDVFWQKTIPVQYGATRRANRWRWNMHIERLRTALDPYEDQFIDQDRLLADIDAMPKGQWLILSVHPLYYGARHAASSAPPLRVDRISTEISDQLGWVTYVPHTIQAQSGEFDGQQEFQAINHSDELGMLDVPKPAWRAQDGLRVLVLGGRNLEGRTTSMTEHATAQASCQLNKLLKRPVSIWKLAHRGMGLARLYGWFGAVKDRIKPHIVMIGLGSDELAQSMPEYWSQATGFSVLHPPGEYLHFKEGQVCVVPRSPGAAIRRGNERPIVDPPNLTQPLCRRADVDALHDLTEILAHFVDAVRQVGAKPMLILQECGESIGLWRSNATHDQRRAGHDCCRATIDSMARRLDVPIVDPYAEFLRQRPELATCWRSVAEWNYTGHRLAAIAMCDTVRQVIEPPATDR